MMVLGSYCGSTSPGAIMFGGVGVEIHSNDSTLRCFEGRFFGTSGNTVEMNTTKLGELVLAM